MSDDWKLMITHPGYIFRSVLYTYHAYNENELLYEKPGGEYGIENAWQKADLERVDVSTCSSGEVYRCISLRVGVLNWAVMMYGLNSAILWQIIHGSG